MTTYSASSSSELPSAQDQSLGSGEGQHQQFFQGRYVVMKRVPDCILCNCDERTYIEEMLFLGYKAAWIARHLPPSSDMLLAQDGTPAKRTTIAERFRSHINGEHSNIEVASGRAIQEHFAEQAGFELAGVSVVNALGVMHEFMQMGYEARKNGLTAPPTVAETAKFATAILKFQEKAGPSHAGVFKEAIRAIVEELQQALDPTTLVWVLRALEARPEVRAAIDASNEVEQRALAG